MSRVVFAAVLGIVLSAQAFAFDTIAPGQTLTGSTQGQGQSTACCDTPVFNHPEKVYQFTTPSIAGYGGGVATIRVTGGQTTNTSPVGTFYPSVYIASSPTGGCETTTTASASTELRVQLVENTTYYITVDGSAAMDSYGQAVAGTFTIQLLYGETYGSARMTPYQASIPNVVKLRYHFAVVNNDTLETTCQGQAWKIGFGPHQFMGAGGSLTEFAGPQANIYSNRRAYQNGTSDHVCYPPNMSNWTQLDSQASLWFSTEDFNPTGHIGSQTRDQSYFPNLTELIDNLTGEWKQEYISQQDLNGLGGLITVSRIGTTTDTTGWSCEATLTPDTRWVWRQTLDFQDGTPPHSVDFALPSATAQYFDRALMTAIYSEAFYVHRGLMRVYYYGFEVQQERSSTWLPLSQWVLDITDAENSTPPLYDWGYRAVTYLGYNAVELSNDTTETFIHLNQTISVANPTACSTSICAATSATACSISTSVTLASGCTLDLSDKDVTIASGVQLSSLGSITLRTRTLSLNGTISSIGGADSTIDLVTTGGLLSSASGSVIQNYSGQVILDSAGSISQGGQIRVGTGTVTVLPQAETDVTIGTISAPGGTLTVGTAQRPACTVYHANPITAGATAVAFANRIATSANTFTTNTAAVTCRCADAQQCTSCANPVPPGTFGAVTPTYTYLPMATCGGGCG